MEGIKPCPYCGGEVEVIKLNQKNKKGEPLYRVECLHCRRLVAKGLGFPDESPDDAEERIRQYDEYMRKYLYGE